MLDGYMDRAELTALMNVAGVTCRCTGRRFGLDGQAMRLGKPVISTAYSGNVDFMTADNSYLVDYREVPLTRDYGPCARLRLGGSTCSRPRTTSADRGAAGGRAKGQRARMRSARRAARRSPAPASGTTRDPER
jgi:hypothetical protein